MSCSVVAGMWVKCGSGLDLGSQIGGSSQQKPVFRVRADRELSLGARFAAKGSGSLRAAVGAGAIPLGKASASGGAEDANVHGGSLAAEEIFLIWEILLVGNPTPLPLESLESSS